MTDTQLDAEQLLHQIESSERVRSFTETDHGQTITTHAGEIVEVRLPEDIQAGFIWEVRQCPSFLRETQDVYDLDGSDAQAEIDSDPFERVFLFAVEGEGERDCERLELVPTSLPGESYITSDGWSVLVCLSTRPATYDQQESPQPAVHW